MMLRILHHPRHRPYLAAGRTILTNTRAHDTRGEAISTAFTESAVSAAPVRPIRTRVFNDQLAGDFRHWYPASARPLIP
jgi:hypothetical protein